MPYASPEKKKEHRKKYYEEHKEELKEKRRIKYQLQKVFLEQMKFLEAI